MNFAQKLPRGVSARPAGHQRPLGVLELVTLLHVGTLVLFAAWAFGGNAIWVRDLLTWWGSLGALITLTAIQNPEARKQGLLRPLRWLWPLGLFNVLVFVSVFHPTFREVTDGLRTLYVESLAKPSPWPSTARPALSLQTLWFFDAIYLSCFNLALVVRQRRALRNLLLVVAANAMALAIFGTVQKLMGANGLFFGAVKSPQVHFFASFIYHNHWGAFTILMTSISLGLVFHYARRNTARDFLHSPAFAGIVAIVLLAASIPLSTSRSCTTMVAVLLLGAFVHWLFRLIRRRRAFRESIVLPLGGAVAVLLGAAALAYNLAASVIATRIAATRAQIAEMQQLGEVIPRQILYRDTWNMAREKIWFGWGMGSYPTVFMTRNSRKNSPVDGLPIYFHDAHSDWLQSASEVGLVGTALLGLCALVPLWHRRRVVGQSPLSIYLLAGCALIVLYAWLEFPFGNRAVIAAWWLCFFCAIHYGRLDGGGDAAT